MNSKQIIQQLIEAETVLADKEGNRIDVGSAVETYPSQLSQSIARPSEGTVERIQAEGVWVRNTSGKLEWHTATYDPRSNAGVCSTVLVKS